MTTSTAIFVSGVRDCHGVRTLAYSVSICRVALLSLDIFGLLKTLE